MAALVEMVADFRRRRGIDEGLGFLRFVSPATSYIIRGGAIKQISENLLEILKDQWPAVRQGRHWSWIVTFSITTNILNRIY